MFKHTNIPMKASVPMTISSEASPASDKALFSDSLLDSTAKERKSRTWATLVSLVLQCLVIGLVLLLPLWFTEALPRQQLLTFLVAPSPPPPPPPPAAAAARVKVVKVTSDTADGRLRTPSRIPAKVQAIREDDAPPVATTSGVVGGVPGGIPGGQLGGVMGGIVGSSSSPAPIPTLSNSAPRPVRVSQGVIQGLLVSRVEPTYPIVAREGRIQGAVVLTAIIDKEGNVLRLQVVSGPPLLGPAAIAAVKQWHYKPFLLNGQPMEVETTITVNFHVQTS